MLVSDGKTALKRYGFSDSDPLLVWLNAAKSEFETARDWPFLFDLSNPSGAVGEDTITLPADFGRVITLRDVTNKNKLNWIEPVEFERLIEDPTEDGQPVWYTIYGTDTLVIWRVLDTAVTWRLVYQATLPDMVNDNVSMPGPTRIHYPIVQKAASIALQAENEEDRAISAESQYQSSVGSLWRRFATPVLDEMDQVVDYQGYGDS